MNAGKMTALIVLVLSAMTALASEASDEWAPIYPAGQDAGPFFEYDINDYVTEGLITHYDGVYNAGRDADGNSLPHDSSATDWKNLVTGAPALNFINRGEGLTGDGWTADGKAYDFAGCAYGYMASALSPAVWEDDNVMTIEMVCDIDVKNQIAKLPVYLTVPGQNSYWYNDGTSFKVNSWAYMSSSKSITLSNWGGQSIVWQSAWEPEATQGTISLSSTSGQKVSVVDDYTYTLPNRRWMIGGLATTVYPNQWSENYGSTKGPWYGVRFYNRALTNDELWQNRLVDDWRFRGIGNVNIAVSATDVTATDANDDVVTGWYNVNGIYEFAAPTQINSADVNYTVNGYVLDVWNRTSGAWETVTNSSDMTFVYTNCLARQRVRVTWQCKEVGRLHDTDNGYDVEDYEQDGLIAQYDGIRNVDKDSGHDPNATEWKSLVDGAPALEFKTRTDEATGYGWTADGKAYDFAGCAYGYMKKALNPSDWENKKAITIEMICNVDLANQVALKPIYLTVLGVNTYLYNEGTSFKMNSYAQIASSTKAMTHKNWDGKSIVWQSMWDTEASTGMVFICSQSGAKTGVPKNWGSYELNDRRWMVGGIVTNQYGHQWSSDYGSTTGSWHAVRFYNRALSDDELAWNRKIDENRFHGGPAVTNVVLATNPSNLQGDQPNGAYEVEGTWLFTAEDRVVDGKKVKLTGYTLHESAAEGGWKRLETREGDRYSYDANAVENEGKIIRLTWNYGQRGFKIIVR